MINGNSKGSTQNQSEPATKIIGSTNPNKLRRRTLDEVISHAMSLPPCKPLLGDLWWEDEVCILFADTNVGKSLLGYQIGLSIAWGKQFYNFPIVEAQKVLYYDFEMKERQVLKRLTSPDGKIKGFGGNFIRVDIPIGFTGNLSKDLIKFIEDDVDDTGAKVVIIDNLSYISDDVEKSSKAASVMKRLQSLCNQKGLSLLVIGHTPKIDNTQPISRENLAGSKQLSNFCDSMIGIGKSYTSEGLRYIKHLKSRDSEYMFDTENVLMCSIEKDENYITSFSFLEEDNEWKHLRSLTAPDSQVRDELKAKAKQMRSGGKSLGDISKELRIPRPTIQRWCK